MRTPVLDRVGRAVVPEHDDRQRPDLRLQPALGLEVGPGSGPYAAGCHRSSSRRAGRSRYLREQMLAIICLVMAPVKPDTRRSELGDTKRKIVERLKRADATPAELAAGLGLTEAAVRQHLDALAASGFVA